MLSSCSSPPEFAATGVPGQDSLALSFSFFPLFPSPSSHLPLPLRLLAGTERSSCHGLPKLCSTPPWVHEETTTPAALPHLDRIQDPPASSHLSMVMAPLEVPCHEPLT